ncbi:MAG: peptidylprolyl isomerase [Sulfobacillus thermotolerans]|nr:peptidylprolyl isomerase [Sulfobacillus thermotolerans]
MIIAMTLRHTLTIPALFLVAAGMLAGCGQQAAPSHKSTPKLASGRNLRWKTAPPMTINPKDTYVATVDTTAGSFNITLFAQQDPHAVNNFVFLAKHRFFNGDEIFRVIKPFMFQTGDPLNNGTGGPGYQWTGKDATVPYEPGIVAMANSGSPTTNGSQFFVCTGAESTSLNQNPIYTELGRVTKGMSVVEKIASGKVKYNPAMQEDSLPVHPYYIQSVTISTTPS